ncbi:hypothetical protein C8J56DRAFT_949197 [Mycena floridula]|nr:hypothetical protein C8J56DRAFT_949197 [Mycena floridula]
MQEMVTSKDAEISSESELPVSTPTSRGFSSTSRIIAATNARKHYLTHMKDIQALFDSYKIKGEFIVRAGFQEDVIIAGQGHRQKFFVHLRSDNTLSRSFLKDLGKVLSPFPVTIHLPTKTLSTNVYDSDGQETSRRGLAANVESLSGGLTSRLTAPSTHLASTSTSAAGPSGLDQSSGDEGKDKEEKDDPKDPHENDDGKGGDDGGGGGGDGSKGRSSPKAHFTSKVDLFEENDKLERCYQSLQIHGKITTKLIDQETHSLTVLALDTQSAAESGLAQQEPSNFYQQFMLQVSVDTECGVRSICSESHPQTTSLLAAARKETATKETGQSSELQGGVKGLLSLSTLESFLKGTWSRKLGPAIERIHNVDQIIRKYSYGWIQWRFTVGDPQTQQYGYQLPQDQLPTIEFETVDIPVPKSVLFEAASYWKRRAEKGTWWDYRQTPYENLCHVFEIEVPSDMKTSTTYIGTVHHGPHFSGDVKPLCVGKDDPKAMSTINEADSVEPMSVMQS